jgi:hypothetical protein
MPLPCLIGIKQKIPDHFSQVFSPHAMKFITHFIDEKHPLFVFCRAGDYGMLLCVYHLIKMKSLWLR